MKSRLFDCKYVCVACEGTLFKVSVCSFVTYRMVKIGHIDRNLKKKDRMNKIEQNWQSIHQNCHFMTNPIQLQLDKQLKIA
jgi:hypothetical protein